MSRKKNRRNKNKIKNVIPAPLANENEELESTDEVVTPDEAVAPEEAVTTDTVELPNIPSRVEGEAENVEPAEYIEEPVEATEQVEYIEESVDSAEPVVYTEEMSQQPSYAEPVEYLDVPENAEPVAYTDQAVNPDQPVYIEQTEYFDEPESVEPLEYMEQPGGFAEPIMGEEVPQEVPLEGNIDNDLELEFVDLDGQPNSESSEVNQGSSVFTDKTNDVKKKKKNKNKNKPNKFFTELIGKITTFFKNNKTVSIAIISVIVVLIIGGVIVSIVNATNKDNSSVSQDVVSENAVSENIIPDLPLEEDAYPEVNEFVATYFEALHNNDIDTIASMRDYIDSVESTKIAVKSNYVEDYLNIVCYTKPGPLDNSYIVYASCDVKLYNYDILAPSLLSLFICTRDDGSLYVYTGETDENIAEYLRAVNSQEDVVDLINRVNANYKEALDSNMEFADYMSVINESIKSEVGEVIAAEIAQENQNDEVEEEPEETTELEPFEVRATDTVNVRVSDSELADKMGRVAAGTVLTCYEQNVNGWSRIEYEGDVGYIKSEYLETLTQANEADESATIGTARARETVNVRVSPSTDSSILGTAYSGQEFSVLENDNDGWTKVIFNGKEGYVKSEYLE